MTWLTATFAPLLLRDYRLLWLVLMATSLALWLRLLGTAQWLLDTTGSAAMVGAIGLVQLVVQLPALLWGGTLADRLNRKGLMVLANGLAALALALLAVLAQLDALSPGVVYLGIALTASAQLFANPARAALAAAVVAPEQLLRATSLDNAMANTAAILGPLLFAALTLNGGVALALGTAALLSACAALLPWLVRSAGRVVAAQQHGTFRETSDGLRYVARHPILPGLFLLDTGITVVSFYRELLPLLALGMFAAGAAATGYLGAGNASGAVLGAFVALAFSRWRAKGMLVLYASLLYGVLLLAFGLAQSLVFGVLLIALLGAADSVTVTVRHTTVMLTTPDELRGRAFSIMVLAAQTANNLGTIWIGFWAEMLGVAQALMLGGLLSILATLLIGWWWRPIRHYRSEPDVLA